MPRRSVADLSVSRPPPPSKPLAPPSDLSASERALWEAVVATKPADWFGADCAPVLKEYVRAAGVCDVLAKRVATALRSADPAGLKKVLDSRHQESVRLAGLATKLRLTQQSRYSARTASTADKRAAGPRPWQPGTDA
jgi:hypothetical protein